MFERIDGNSDSSVKYSIEVSGVMVGHVILESSHMIVG